MPTMSFGSNGSSEYRNETIPVSSIRAIRSLFSGMVRSFGRRVGMMFGGLQDTYKELGYPDSLDISDYRGQYERGGIAERIIELIPNEVWGNGATIESDPDPHIETQFESQSNSLLTRLKAWNKFRAAHVLSRLGHFSVILIGAPGRLEEELPRLKGPDDIKYLRAIAEDSVLIEHVAGEEGNEIDFENPRFGQPDFYTIYLDNTRQGHSNQIIRDSTFITSKGAKGIPRRVHWSRVIHVSQNPIDGDLYSAPELRSIYNLLLDLLCVVGGGSRAAWTRANPGVHADFDPDSGGLGDDEEERDKNRKELIESVKDYAYRLQRFMVTSGVKLDVLQAQVDKFQSNADAIMFQICASKGIPLRVLVGSDKGSGEQASRQDRNTFYDLITFIRLVFAVPSVVVEFLDRLIKYGGLVSVDRYDVVWPEIEELDEKGKAEVAKDLTAANLNQSNASGELFMSPSEIRGSVYDMEPLESDMEMENGVNETISNELENEIRSLSEGTEFNKYILVGGPRGGKSTFARSLREKFDIPTYCTDPRSLVKDVELDVEYLPEGLSWSESSEYIAEKWLTMSGPWCVEGVASVRALRKLIYMSKEDTLSDTRIIVLTSPQVPIDRLSTGRLTMWKSIRTIWNEIGQFLPQAKMVGNWGSLDIYDNYHRKLLKNNRKTVNPHSYRATETKRKPRFQTRFTVVRDS